MADMDDRGTTASEPGESDLGTLLAMLRRRSALILAAVVLTVGVAVGLSAMQEPQYDSTSSIVYRPYGLDSQLTQLPIDVSIDATRSAQTNLSLITLEEVRNRAATRLGKGYTAKSLDGQLEIGATNESNLIEVTARADSPQEAKRVVDTVAMEFVGFRRDQVRRDIRRAISGVKAQLETLESNPATNTRAQTKDFRSALQRLELLDTIQRGDLEIAQRGSIASDPSSPKPVRNGIMALIVGLIIGVALAFGAEQLDRRFRSADEVESAVGSPVLAIIPKSKHLEDRDGWAHGITGSDQEGFRLLRANLDAPAIGGSPRSLMITSDEPDAGKTTVALQLGLAAAAAGKRVLLVEADLRRGSLAETLGIPPGAPGLAEILLRSDLPDLRAARDDAGLVTQWTHDPATTDPAPRQTEGTLQVLLAGRAGGDANELLQSPRFAELITHSTEDFDLVIVDTPPIGVVADAIPITSIVDGVLLVVRLRRDVRRSVVRLAQTLGRLDVRVLGVVATFGSSREDRYRSGYHGYYSS